MTLREWQYDGHERGQHYVATGECLCPRCKHVCQLADVWPTGHPLPPVDPDRLTGPEVGALCVITSKYNPGRVVRVLERSYVWSPGECRNNGGYRRYDWSLVTDEHGYRVVMNDKDLITIVPGMDVAVVESES
jgi:hypothetical protein